jgi:hypothetical protein
MRKTIQGTTYDTETAVRVAHAESDHGRNDFKWWDETLYKTRKGGWFLHGQGNAMSCYGRRCGRDFTEGQKIVPMDKIEARHWLARYSKPEAYRAYFTPDEA